MNEHFCQISKNSLVEFFFSCKGFIKKNHDLRKSIQNSKRWCTVEFVRNSLPVNSGLEVANENTILQGRSIIVCCIFALLLTYIYYIHCCITVISRFIHVTELQCC